MPLVRRRFARAVLAVLGTTLIAGSGCLLRSRGTPPVEHAIAPEFTLPDQDGRTVALADLRAHGPVVVVFYRGHW